VVAVGVVCGFLSNLAFFELLRDGPPPRPSAPVGSPEVVTVGADLYKKNPSPSNDTSSTTDTAGPVSATSTKPGRADCDALPRVARPMTSNVVEPYTGVSFPDALLAPDGSHVMRLVAHSVRCMMNLCKIEPARAYSYALYMSSAAVGKGHGAASQQELYARLFSLAQAQEQNNSLAFISSPGFTGARAGYVFKNDKLGVGYYRDAQSEQSLPNAPPAVMLRMVLARNIDGPHMAKGFDRSMLKRVRAGQNGERKGSGKVALKEFTKFFSDKEQWAKGTTIDFLRTPAGALHVLVYEPSGQVTKQIEFDSALLTWALFDTYLGEKGHLSSACQSNMVQRVNSLFSKRILE
jgi:hypothetical protein